MSVRDRETPEMPAGPRLYLDTNIYSFVVDRGEAAELPRWLAGRGAGIVLSDLVQGETLAVRDGAIRDPRLRLMRAVLSRTPEPVGYLLALEFVAAVRRTRPGWIAPFPDTSKVRVYLNRHRRRWSALRDPPPWLTNGSDRYLALTDAAIEHNRSAQRAGRERAGSDEEIDAVCLSGVRIALPDVDRRRPEDAWRLELLMTWHMALFPPHVRFTRDLRDFAAPYLSNGAPPVRAFADWCLTIADPAEMPRHWAATLVAQEQLRSKIGRGNAMDAMHAAYLIDCDYLITADRAFHAQLAAVADQVPGAATPLLVDRADASALQALDAALTIAGSR